MTDTLDRQPRYAPVRTIVCGAKGIYLDLPVRQTIIYPIGCARPAGCPIREGYTVVELRTAEGSAWHGVAEAWINSELRVVVRGIDRRDEVRMSWPISTAD